MPLEPKVYADLLTQKINKHNANCWLVNTGLSGGPYGVGSRIDLKHTRAIVRAILENKLADVSTQQNPAFAIGVPTQCPDVPSKLLDPRSTWSDPQQYDQKAAELADRFEQNYRQYVDA